MLLASDLSLRQDKALNNVGNDNPFRRGLKKVCQPSNSQYSSSLGIRDLGIIEACFSRSEGFVYHQAQAIKTA